MRYMGILLLLSGCMSPCSGGCDDKGAQEILDMCKTRTDCFQGAWYYPAPTQPLLEVPMIPSPNTVVIIPPGVIYGY